MNATDTKSYQEGKRQSLSWKLKAIHRLHRRCDGLTRTNTYAHPFIFPCSTHTHATSMLRRTALMYIFNVSGVCVAYAAYVLCN